MSIVVTGKVYSNGGGGGSGCDIGLEGVGCDDGNPGENGMLTSNGGALGGHSVMGQGGGGGFGGVKNTTGGNGGLATGNSSDGGGGGSTGFFQTYTPATVTPTVTPSDASPQFEANRTLTLR
jgi:hypothetical protein